MMWHVLTSHVHGTSMDLVTWISMCVVCVINIYIYIYIYYLVEYVVFKLALELRIDQVIN